MRAKTALLTLLNLVPMLATGVLAVAAAEPPASAPMSPAPTALLSPLSAAQLSPCSAPAATAERAIFAASSEELVNRHGTPCGACSGLCAGLQRGSMCALGGGTGPMYCEVDLTYGECLEDGLWRCYCGSPTG